MGIISFFRLKPDPPSETPLPMLNKFYKFFGLEEGTELTVKSPYFRPWCLCLIGSILAIYCWISLFVYFGLLASQKSKFLRKQAWKLLSDIMFHSYLSMVFYFTFAAYHTHMYILWKRNPLSKWPKPFQVAHLVLQSTVLTFPLFCTIIYVYWTLPGLPGWYTRPLTKWSTITFYMLNTVFSYIELALSAARPRPWSHLLVVIVILGLYLAFHSILVSATGGKVWIYTVLKYSLSINKGGISALRALGLCILGCVSFGVMQLLSWLKCRYLGLLEPKTTTELNNLHTGGETQA